jgi:DNA-binding transcriptional ArsR family regulator
MTEAPTVFAAIADPTRRGILERLRGRELAAGEVGRAFPAISQPGMSRHLRVLRESGLVDARRDEQRWVYSLRPKGFSELDAWISHYRAFWPEQLDALARHLDGGQPARKKSSTRPSP